MGVSETVSALSELLNSGTVTARQAAERASKEGIHLPYGTIAAYWSGGHGRPSVATLAKLAKVVPFSEKQLQEAAWNTTAPLGLYRPPAESALLNDRQRRAVDEIIRVIVATQGVAHVDSSPTTSQSGAQSPKKQEADAEGSSQSSADELAKRRPPPSDLDDTPPPIEFADAARNEPGHVKTGDRVQHVDTDTERGETSE